MGWRGMFRWALTGGGCAAGLTLQAVDVGDSRAEVLAELGRPRGTMQVGESEILNYGTGQIVLVDGRVTRVAGVPQAGPAQAMPRVETRVPAPAPAAVSPPTPVRTTAPTASWLTDLAAAQAAAQRAQPPKRILVLFTGSDWCPPCQQFEREVAHDSQFAGIFAPAFVFLKIDWLRHQPMSPGDLAEVRRLHRAYGVSSFPTLMVLNAAGEELAEVDWTRARSGSFKEIMIEAIDEARQATKDGRKASRGWWPF